MLKEMASTVMLMVAAVTIPRVATVEWPTVTMMAAVMPMVEAVWVMGQEEAVRATTIEAAPSGLAMEAATATVTVRSAVPMAEASLVMAASVEVVAAPTAAVTSVAMVMVRPEAG